MTRHDRPADEAAIRALIEAQADGVRRKDAPAALATYTRDVVSYDLAPPLAHKAAEALDPEGIEAWFATWTGPIGYETKDLSVTIDDSMALCHGFVRIFGTKTDGARADVWTRRTLVLRREEDAWRIMHEHLSVPFYMDGSFKAAVDLHP